MQSKKNKSGFTIRNNIIYVQGSVDGEFKRYSTGKKDTKLNLDWIKKNSILEFQRIHAEKSKANEFSAKFIDYAYLSLSLKKNKIKENTYKEYLGLFEKAIKPSFVNHNLKDITRLELRVWQNSLVESGKSGKTANNYRVVFNNILEDARKDGLIERNPFHDLDKERVIKPTIEPFSLDEIQEILRHATGFEKEFILISFFTGMRTGELLALKWEDINFFTKQIHIKKAIRKGIYDSPKTESSIRSIDMLPVVEEAFNRLKFNSFLKNSFVFLDSKGKPFYDSTYFSNML